MKKFFKNVILGILIGLAMIPFILLEAYYFGNPDFYLSEICNIKNLKNLIIVTCILGIWTITASSIWVTSAINLERTEKDNKNILIFWSIKTFLLTLFMGISLSLPDLLNVFSDTMVILLQLNTTILVILLIIITTTKESLEIQKINKKLGDKK